MELLLAKYPGIKITEAILISAIDNGWPAAIKFLLGRDPEIEITEDFVMATILTKDISVVKPCLPETRGSKSRRLS